MPAGNETRGYVPEGRLAGSDSPSLERFAFVCLAYFSIGYSGLFCPLRVSHTVARKPLYVN